MKKLFFHFLDLSVLNVFLLHKSCGGEVSHKQFRTKLICELVQNVDMTITRVQRGRSSSSAPQLSRLEAHKFNHWPVKGTKRRCVVCSLRKKWSTSSYFCWGCAVTLCVSPCFEEYHTKTNI
jgi:predicted nucleic acid binding AN1-type Zn finger protein